MVVCVQFPCLCVVSKVEVHISPVRGVLNRKKRVLSFVCVQFSSVNFTSLGGILNRKRTFFEGVQEYFHSSWETTSPHFPLSLSVSLSLYSLHFTTIIPQHSLNGFSLSLFCLGLSLTPLHLSTCVARVHGSLKIYLSLFRSSLTSWRAFRAAEKPINFSASLWGVRVYSSCEI